MFDLRTSSHMPRCTKMCDGIWSACAAAGAMPAYERAAVKRERRVIGIVERVNDEVRGARMLRVLREHLLGDRRGERLAAEALVGRPHGAEQRQRVPRRDFVIVGPLRIHRRQRLRVRGVARELVARRVIEDVDRLEERLLLRQLRFRLARVRASARSSRGSPSRPSSSCCAHSGWLWLIASPQYAIANDGIRFLRALERDRGFVELEAVQVLHALDERAPARRRSPEFGNVIVPSSWELIGDAIATNAIDSDSRAENSLHRCLLYFAARSWAARGR